MHLQQRINAFAKLGAFLSQFSVEKTNKIDGIEHNEIFFDGFLHQIKLAKEKGFTIVPLRIFFNDKHYAKMEIGIGRGKKEYDKRETIKNRDIDKDIKRILAK